MTGEAPIAYECDTCKEWFYTERAVRCHIKWFHKIYVRLRPG